MQRRRDFIQRRGLDRSQRVSWNPSGASRSGGHRPDVVVAHRRCGTRPRDPGQAWTPGIIAASACLCPFLRCPSCRSSFCLPLLALTLPLLFLLTFVFRCFVDAPHLTAIVVGGVVERTVSTKLQVDRPRPSGKSRDSARGGVEGEERSAGQIGKEIVVGQAIRPARRIGDEGAAGDDAAAGLMRVGMDRLDKARGLGAIAAAAG